MKKLYFESIQNDEVGEVEGFFDEDGNLLGLWSLNDADWRGEYFNGFLRRLGFEVFYNGKYEKSLIKEAKKEWGIK